MSLAVIVSRYPTIGPDGPHEVSMIPIICFSSISAVSNHTVVIGIAEKSAKAGPPVPSTSLLCFYLRLRDGTPIFPFFRAPSNIYQ
jgi:hypothetical protein